MSRNRHLFCLLLILLLAATLRIYHMNLQSLWIDEGFTWNLTQYADPLLILRLDVHPPLYFLAIRAWVQVTGTSVIAMRFFSVLPSLLTVAVVYQLAREIERQRGRKTIIPLIAALLMALTDAEIALSQEVRAYTWHVLFATMSMLGFLHWIRTHKRQSLLLWMFSTIALVYTFYLGAFIGIVQGLYVLLFLKDESPKQARYITLLHKIGIRRIQALSVLVLCATALLPWLLYSAGQQANNISRGEVIRPQDYGFWMLDFRLRYFGQQWALMMGLVIFGLFIVRYVDGRMRVKIDAVSILLLLWLSVPLLLMLIGNSFVPLYQPRRVTQIVPVIALLTAFGIGNLPKGLARWFTIAVIMVYGLAQVDFGRFKQPWREMVADTAPYIAPQMPLLFELGGDDYAPRFHYAEALPNSYDFLLDRPSSPSQGDNVLIGLTTWRHLESDSYEAGLPSLIDSLDHLWLFYWSSDLGALQWLETFGQQRTATFTVDFNPDVFLYRYDHLPEEPLIRFQNGMVLQYAQAYDTLLLDMLWTTDTALDTNYTTSAFLLNESGQLVAQLDSQPFLNQRPTSTWTNDDFIYDPKLMQTINGEPLAAGTYTVGIVIYSVQDGQIVRVLTASEADFFTLGMLVIDEN
ncbi:MAG: glycosyltransferase family 39 protein [Anaerolineae bacterium]|nr:glycosyltransferase family 39 protein [Anaerolineae bacterium]MDQ7035131.1 glycosyltransferase family 39 protein [Anaerolineae bacterium]